ncbi:MAG: hypothetical protein HN380_21355 [Victivallales bacterium]|nr:hypothetical protein [Victivallales bacterium]
MGSLESGPQDQWTTSRVLRLVVPPLVVLLVALALREKAPPPDPSAPPPSHGTMMGPVPESAPKARILLFAKDAATRAVALRARVNAGIEVVPVPKSDRERLAKQYGIDQLPAVVIEQPDGKRSVHAAGDAALSAVVEQCRKLGLPLAEAEH